MKVIFLIAGFKYYNRHCVTVKRIMDGSVCTEQILFLSLLPAFLYTPYCDRPSHAQNHNNPYETFVYCGYQRKQELYCRLKVK